MIKKMILVGWVLILVGCAYTLEGVMSEQPEVVAEVPKTRQEFSNCLYNAWFDLGPTFRKEEDDRTVISMNYNGAVGVAAAVEGLSSGAKVSFYNPNVLTSSRFREAVERCM